MRCSGCRSVGDNEAREQSRGKILTSPSVVFCLISCSIRLLSSSSTAESSCLLSTRVVRRDDFVELLVDPDRDPVEYVDLGDNPDVSVDEVELIVS